MFMMKTVGPTTNGTCTVAVYPPDSTHYRVSKTASDGVTQSAVRRLDETEREEELARMLGGVELTREARAAAKRLLRNVA